MELVIGRLLNKQVAHELGVSQIMVKTDERKVTEKMQARSLPDLVRGAHGGRSSGVRAAEARPIPGTAALKKSKARTAGLDNPDSLLRLCYTR